MFSRILIALVAVFSLAGCGSVPLADKAQDAAIKTFAAKPDVAGVYVYRDQSVGAIAQHDVEVDGNLIGRTGAHTFLYKEIAPGKHTVTSKAENSDSIQFDAVAGQLYFFWQEVQLGFIYGRTKLHLVGAEAGRLAVLECTLAESK